MLERLAQDIRFSFRLLRKSSGFAAVAIVTLAIGLGANTAIFSVLDAVLLRPLPYPDASRLMRIWQSEPQMGEGRLGTAPPEFAGYRDRTRAFSTLAGYQPESLDLTDQGQPEHLAGYLASASLFRTLGVRPLLGRTFTAQEELPGSARVIVLSYEFWRRHFAADPSILARLVRLNEQPYQIIGVMPKGFTFPATAATPGVPPAFWAPLRFTAAALNDWASSFDTEIIARLRDGVSVLQAREDVERIATEFQREHSDIYSGNVRLAAEAEPWGPEFGPKTGLILGALSAAVGFVLLIACANVANLLLARAGAREREMSVRRALGASSAALARQLLVETALLSVMGGAAGCALAYGVLGLMNALSLKEVNMQAAAINLPVLLFAFLLCTVTCVLCASAPVWIMRRSSVNEALRRSGARAGESRTSRRISQSLIVSEVACCVILLIASALLVRSFLRILDVPPGFDPLHKLLVRATLNRRRYSPDKRHAVEHEIAARLSTLPGVSAIAVTTHVPLADERQIGFLIDGAARDDFHWADNSLVSGTYFNVMSIPLLRGRTFSDLDSPHSPLVAIINQSMARQYWPKQDAIGKGFLWGGRHLTVIGVAGDVHVKALDQPVAPTIYNSVYQMESGASTSAVFLVQVSARQDPMKVAAAAQKSIWSVDRGIPILGFSTVQRVVAGSLAIRRASLLLVGSFAGIALLLGLIGIYGVLSYAVIQRVHEMGVRLAVGAKPVEIARLVTGEGVRLTIWGVLCGVAAASVMARFASKLVFGIRALDPISFGAGVLLILAVALVASYLPARRAARVDPMRALRCE